MNIYDDAYKMLANTLVVSMSPANIGRLLSDRDYARILIRHEVQGATDIVGPFCDAVVTEAVRNDVVGWKRDLADFAAAIDRRLDIARLRHEVVECCHELGVEPVFLGSNGTRI